MRDMQRTKTEAAKWIVGFTSPEGFGKRHQRHAKKETGRGRAMQNPVTREWHLKGRKSPVGQRRKNLGTARWVVLAEGE